VVDYFEQFGAKMCYFDDVHLYLEALTQDERARLGNKMDAVAAGATDGVSCGRIQQTVNWADRPTPLSDAQTLKTAQRVINASKVVRFLAPLSDAATESSAAVAYLGRYFEALPLGEQPQAGPSYPFQCRDALIRSCWALRRQRTPRNRAPAGR